MTMAGRRQCPDMPHEEFARQAKFAKPQYREQSREQVDTKALKFRKIHPTRDEGYKRFLRFEDCSVKGLTDSLTDQPHVCWTPDRFKSDPAHTGKAYSGTLKRGDTPTEFSSGMFSLCRHAHRQQENDMDGFDRRFGINRHEIARMQHAQYLAKKERNR